jgi:hypothetical protein
MFSLLTFWGSHGVFKLKFVVFSSLLLLCGCAGTPPQTASLTGDPEQKICRNDVAMTGTLIPRSRVCLTAAQWKDIEDRSQQAITHAQTMPQQHNPKE